MGSLEGSDGCVPVVGVELDLTQEVHQFDLPFKVLKVLS